MKNQRRKTHKYSLGVYLLLANGITWLCWIPGLLAGAQHGYIMPNFDSYYLLFREGFSSSQHLLLGIAFQLGVYGPLIGGLVAIWMDGGREGLVDLWKKITRWRIGGKWYLTALVITLLMGGFPVVIYSLAGGFTPSAFALSYILIIFLIQLLTSGLGEEPGWRGFLLPRLQNHYTGDKFVWILGLIWAIWHYPLMIIQSFAGMPDVSLPQALIMILLSLAGFTMSIIGITFIYVWLYNKTQSLLLMIVFHAFSNTFSFWFSSFLKDPQAITIFVALMPWVVVLIMQKRLGEEWFLGMNKQSS